MCLHILESFWDIKRKINKDNSIYLNSTYLIIEYTQILFCFILLNLHRLPTSIEPTNSNV